MYPRLKGAFAPGIAPYTNIIIDVYQPDPEGWANGKLCNLLEMTGLLRSARNDYSYLRVRVFITTETRQFIPFLT